MIEKVVKRTSSLDTLCVPYRVHKFNTQLLNSHKLCQKQQEEGIIAVFNKYLRIILENQ
jgi:hypothetical protein